MRAEAMRRHRMSALQLVRFEFESATERKSMVYHSDEKIHDLEGIADLFLRPEIKVVSFDIFDTLLLRPTGGESDKYALLDRVFHKLSSAHISFGKVRTMAEASLRRKILSGEISREDITIDEIYKVIRDLFHIDPRIASEMQREEEELEERLCTVRKSGRYLYEKALQSGRTVIFISDMYLKKEQIEKLLRMNGFDQISHLFISSETGLRKSTGSLFRQIPSFLGVEPGEILHIGDNREQDCEMAEKCGFQTAWLPKTMDAFLEYGCGHQAEKICRDLTDWEKALREPGIRAMRQMAANFYFDDPFRSFDRDSDYNADPFFVGYAALGPEILSLVRWIIDNTARDHVSRILFLSRDGYLPMKAYELFRACDPDLPEYGYLYCSRIAMLPVMVKEPADLFDLPIDITRHTPEKLLDLLSFCAKENAAEREYSAGVPFTAASFQQFISDFIDHGYDPEKHGESREMIRKYLLYNKSAPVKEGTAVFDMGYSGRIAGAIREASGLSVPVYYFHADESRHFMIEGQQDFRIRTFFDFSPYMESTLREYAFLETAPSCIGYREGTEPVFDKGPAGHYCENARAMQEGALLFVKEYLRYFGDYESQTGFRYHNAAMPFEAFLRHCSPADMEIYRDVEIDDELWGGRRNINLKALMEARLRKLPEWAGQFSDHR